MKFSILASIGVIWTLSVSASAPTTANSIQDPQLFLAQLKEMGYAPAPLDLSDETPQTEIKVRGGPLAIVLGGCTNKKNCTYVVAGGHFSDILNPPAAWVARQNSDYDLIKISVTDKGQLSYVSSAYVEGLPRETFRAWIDQVDASSSELGQLAKKDGLVKP